jgi:malonate-semialdehyde dehydrogenase (acetylating) / methylmalonate-semialdehyde dehydrogenase
MSDATAAGSSVRSSGTIQVDGICEIQNFINGKFVRSRAKQFFPVMNPGVGKQIAKVPLSPGIEVDDAVRIARSAFSSWAAMPIKERAQVFYRYKVLVERDFKRLAELVEEENGKTAAEAKAEIDRAIEIIEFAASMPQLAAGEVMEVSRGVECRVERFPLGVVASVTPFNFPNMVPNWTIPNALVLGNTMVLKPSQFTPFSAIRIAELLKEAGLPDGVFNIVNGAQESVETLCDHTGIEALTFVGSTRAAKAVYVRSTSHLKRALCLGGAKNHLILLPDANETMAASNIIASMSGCAGQRCMAASAMVAVGNVDHIIKLMCEEARKIIPGKNLGAVISADSKNRIEGYITEAEQQGATILVDGRNAAVDGRPNGFYIGPTVIDNVRPEMKIAQEEVFGPVLSIVRVKTLDEALAIENANPYGNAAAVFTQSGGLARYVMERASAGMIGINIGVPVPRDPFSFGGWNDSKFGACDITGKSSVEFFTKMKKTTTKWNPESKANWMS